MGKVDIVEFARTNGVFSSYSPDGLQYIGDNAQELNDITLHELMFLDMYGYIRTWSFRVADATGAIIPYDDGFMYRISGFNPDEMRKKLAMLDKVKAARDARTA